MKITVHYFAQARLAAGVESATVEVTPSCTPRQAVRAAADAGSDELRHFLFDADGQPRRSNLLLVGQRRVAWDSPQTLADGDSVTILPPIAGG
jgi:molybdopterin converting factor small subunit